MWESSAVIDLETVACPSCSGRRATLWLQVPGARAVRGNQPSRQHEQWQLERCSECGLVFLNPRPTERAAIAFYRLTEYLPFCSAAPERSALARLYGWLRRYNVRWKRKAVSRWKARGRLLDVGCGTGEFLQEMQRAGWQVTGVERDAAAAQFARQALHLNVLTGGVETVLGSGERFDTVTLWHVVEHLYQPLQTLRQVRELLCDGGMVVVAVPNVGSVDAKFYGQHWVAFDPPRHVQHFSLATLRMLAASVGLRLLSWRQLPLDAFFNALMSESIPAARAKSWPGLWPLRLGRSFLVACASLTGGSRNIFFSGTRGATIVASFVKEAA